MQAKFQKPTVQPKKPKNKLKASDENTQSEVEYTYDRLQDDHEVKQQFSRYLDQDVYFN